MVVFTYHDGVQSLRFLGVCWKSSKTVPKVVVCGRRVMVNRKTGFRETLSLRLSNLQMDALEMYERRLSSSNAEEYGINVAARHLLEQGLVASGDLTEMSPLPERTDPEKRIKQLEAELAKLKRTRAVEASKRTGRL